MFFERGWKNEQKKNENINFACCNISVIVTIDIILLLGRYCKTLTNASVSLCSRQNVMCLPLFSRFSILLVNRLSSHGKLSKCCWKDLFWNSTGSMISKSLNRFGSLSSSIVNDGCRIKYDMCAWLSSSNVFALSNARMADAMCVIVVVDCGVGGGFLVVL